MKTLITLMLSLFISNDSAGNDSVEASSSPNSMVTAYFTVPASKKPEGLPSTTPATGLADLISSARDEVLFCMYRFNHEEILGALVAAHQRGLKVAVVTDQDYWTSSYAEAFSRLKQAGIEVRVDHSLIDGVMHHKFVVLDRRTVWTGDWNAHTNDSFKSYHTALHIRNQELAMIYAEAFESLWHGHVPDSYNKTLAVSGRTIETTSGVSFTARFSPADSGIAPIAQALAKAENRILVAHNYLNNRTIVTELVRARQRGLDVKVVYGSVGFGFDRMLALHDVDIRKGPGFMGAKFIIVDSHSLITGSWNMGPSETDFENLLAVHRATGLCRQFEDYFNQLFQASADFYSTPRSSLVSIEDGGALGPAITPVTLFERDDLGAQIQAFHWNTKAEPGSNAKAKVSVEIKPQELEGQHFLDFYLTEAINKMGPLLDPRNRPLPLHELAPNGSQPFHGLAEFVYVTPPAGKWLAFARIVKADAETRQREVVAMYAASLDVPNARPQAMKIGRRRRSLVAKFGQASLVAQPFTRVERPATVGGARMNGIFAHPPYGVEGARLPTKDNRLLWPKFSIGKNARFETHLGLASDRRQKSDGVVFMVVVDEEIIAQRLVGADPDEPDAWLCWSVDLSRFRRKTVSFELRVGPNGNANNDHAIWGDPAIVN